MTDTEALKKAIKTSGYKAFFIAESLGISTETLRRKMSNETGFYANEIKLLCKLLHINTLTEKEKIFFADKVDCKATEANYAKN